MSWLALLFLCSLFRQSTGFEGKEYWMNGHKDNLDKCKKTNNGDWTKDPALRCYIVHDKLHFFKVEVLSTKPIVLRYHNLIHRRLCKRVLGEVSHMRLERAGVVSTDPKKPLQYMTNRMANSSWLDHRQEYNFNHMFNTLQRTILALDLSKAEQFQILSYHPNGHYAPHYDYLESNIISTVPMQGNRITTVFTILKTAKKGGTTIFPRLGLNIRPNTGDVLVWQNMEATGENDLDSIHAACPIVDGVKIGATLWVRAFGSEFRLPCTKDKKWSLEAFLKPKATWDDRVMYCKTVGPS